MWGLTLTLRQEGICAGAVPGGPAILVATLGCGREQMGGIDLCVSPLDLSILKEVCSPGISLWAARMFLMDISQTL